MKKMAVNFVLSLWYSPGLGGQFSVVLVSFLSLYINNWEKSTNPKKKKFWCTILEFPAPGFLAPLWEFVMRPGAYLLANKTRQPNKWVKKVSELVP